MFCCAAHRVPVMWPSTLADLFTSHTISAQYSKQSKQKKRGTVPAKLIATLLKTAGVSEVRLLLYLHAP